MGRLFPGSSGNFLEPIKTFGGIGFALRTPTLDMATTSTYAEPTVMWRLRHKDGRVASAIIAPQGVKAYAGWFILGRLEEARHCDSWHSAITWVEQVRLRLTSSGWRPRR
jgi:hypothetical protein